MILNQLREASLYISWGRNIIGVRTKFDTDDVKRWGATNFGLSPKGGRKILDLINFFSMFLKHNFFMFWGYFGHFSFLGPRGAKNFRRVAKGGEKF